MSVYDSLWKQLYDGGDVRLRGDVAWMEQLELLQGHGNIIVASGKAEYWVGTPPFKVFTIENGSVVLEKNDINYQVHYKSPPSAVQEIGKPISGYQFYQFGSKVVVKRTPDLTPYNKVERYWLTSHPNAHTLEKHGHDVTDEMLIRRARTGKAPDNTGSNQPPSHSSAFYTPEDLKEALHGSLPGSAAFLNGSYSANGDTVKVTYRSSRYLGRGFLPHTTTAIPMKGSLATFRKLQNGMWSLETMHPMP